MNLKVHRQHILLESESIILYESANTTIHVVLATLFLTVLVQHCFHLVLVSHDSPYHVHIVKPKMHLLFTKLKMYHQTKNASGLLHEFMLSV